MGFRFIYLCFFCSSAFADLDCEVALKYGLVINQQQIRVIDDNRTVYQINGDSQLMVGGNWIELKNEEDSQNLADLANGLHLVVPKMILLANEGVDLAIETVEQVYSGLMGKDHKSQEKLQDSLQKVQKSVREKFIHANDTYYMGPGRLENMDDFVDRELEEQIEQVMSTSVGGILSAIGGLVTNEQKTEQKVEDLAIRLETMGTVIEHSVAPKAQSLKQKAEWFCKKFNELDRIEESLRLGIPELKPYDILVTGKAHSPNTSN